METNRFKGSHASTGTQQGHSFKAALRGGFDAFKQLDLVQSMKPRGMPASRFLWIAGSIAKKRLEPIFKSHAQKQCERIKGIAYGAMPFRACFLEGISVACDLVFLGNHVKLELKNMTFREFLAIVSDHGLGHHWIVGYSEVNSGMLVDLFGRLGIDVIQPRT
jgi:hypothetical protein